MNDKSLLGPERLGIWALNTTALWRSSSNDDALHVVDPPRYGNRNLIAQNGVFTVHIHPWLAAEVPLCESLDRTIDRLYSDASVIGRAKLRLLTLPARKARKLLTRLESEHVTASVLFPGYDGVVRFLSEEIMHSQSAWRAPAREE